MQFPEHQLEDPLRLHDEKRADLLIADAQSLRRSLHRARAADRRQHRSERRAGRKISPVQSRRAPMGSFAATGCSIQLCPFQGTSHASRRRMPNEKVKAQMAMMPMPTKTTSVARNCEADMMR